MAVFRIEKNKNYTVMVNYHLRDISLSLKAKGLLSLMLSLPEGWDYTTKGLACICKDGVDSICPRLKSWRKPAMCSADGSEMNWGISRRSSTQFWKSLSAQHLRRNPRCPTALRKPGHHLNGKSQSWMLLFWTILNRLSLNRQFLHRKSLNRKIPPN